MKLSGPISRVVGVVYPRARFPRSKESVLALTRGKLNGGSRLPSLESVVLSLSRKLSLLFDVSKQESLKLYYSTFDFTLIRFASAFVRHREIY